MRFYDSKLRDYQIYALPRADGFDRFAMERDERLQRSGSLRYVSEELVGYSAYFITKHLHYAGLIHASNDVLFLRPDARRGATALRFLDWTEQQLRALGAMKLTYHIKFSLDWRPILHRRGYRDEEVMCGKLL